MGRIVLREGDITEEAVDAIVNAANSDLVLGSGVAGAIRAKGGPTIQAECDTHGPVDVGGAALTGAGELPARFVLHAAGMPLGGSASEDSVASSLRASLALADEKGCRSVAVPAIGAGVGGLSIQRSAELLLEVAREHLAGETGIEEIRFVLFGEPTYRIFESTLDGAKVEAQMKKLRERSS
ncbi:MAG: macro domain-containing protein [Myxococcales bacterium]|nr:macro domain-containing protein [Myxococcales bacterium]